MRDDCSNVATGARLERVAKETRATKNVNKITASSSVGLGDRLSAKRMRSVLKCE